MAPVNETIVREYFELHQFVVRQFRKHIAPAGREDDEIDLLALNPHAQPPPAEQPFVLGSDDLAAVARAVVVIKAWHTEVFSPTFLATHSSELFRFLGNKAFQKTLKLFAGDSRCLTILVIPALPRETVARNQSVALLKSKGIDAVLPFRTMLAALVTQVHPSRNYVKSDLLQVLRILKNYDFLKEPQLDLFKTGRGKSSPK